MWGGVPSFMDIQIVRCVLIFEFIVFIHSQNCFLFCFVFVFVFVFFAYAFRGLMTPTYATKIDIDRVKMNTQYIVEVLFVCG